MIPLDSVVAELRVLRRRTFGERKELTLAQQLPELAAAARTVYGVPPNGDAPIRRLMIEAVSRVSPSELRPAVSDLFGLATTYGKTFAFRQAAAAQRFSPPPPQSTFRQAPQYSQKLLESLAAAVVERLAGATLDELRTQLSHEWIDRPALIESGVVLLAQGARMLWIWGEPGTGKTVLADQLANRLVTRHPVVRLHMGNRRVMQEDLTRELGEPGTDEAGRVALFRRRLAEGGFASMVILDGAVSPAQVASLGLGNTGVPIIVTSNVRPYDGTPALHVGNLPAGEAELIIGVLLPNLDTHGTARLATLAAGRPLALNQVSRYLLASELDPGDVLDGLELDAGRVLEAIESTAERGLIATYRAMLRDFATLGDTMAVLDSLLWITEGDVVDRSLADDFLSYRFPGAVGSVLVSSAEVLLTRHGILTIEKESFGIHSLTGKLLRRLRKESMTAVITDFLDFLGESPPDEPLINMRCQLHADLAVTSGLWDDSSQRSVLLCLTPDTWLRVSCRNDIPARSAMIYRVTGLGITVQVDAEDLRLMKVSEPDLSELVAQVGDYSERVDWRTHFQAEPDDDLSEDSGGYTHKVRRTNTLGLPIARREETIHQAVCGRRWRIKPADQQPLQKPMCPRCVQVDWRDAVRSWRQMGVTTTFRRLREEFDAAVKLGSRQRAVDLRRKMDEFVDHTRAHLTTVLLSELAEADAALADLVVTDDPSNASALYGRAAARHYQCAAYLVDDDERFRRLTKSSSAYVYQGIILFSSDPSAAVAAFRRATFVERTCLEIRPQDTYTKDTLGLTLTLEAQLVADHDLESALGSLDEAISILRGELGRRTKSALSSKRALADALSVKATILRATDSEHAVEMSVESAGHYRVLVETFPDDAAMLRHLVRQAHAVADVDRNDQSPDALGRWAELEFYARRLCTLLPEDIEARHNLGLILYRRVHALRGAVDPDLAARLHSEATALFKNLPDLRPQDPKILHEAAMALSLLAGMDLPDAETAGHESIYCYRRYLEYCPNDAVVAEKFARLLIWQAGGVGSAHPVASDAIAEAISVYRRLPLVEPGSATSRDMAFALGMQARTQDDPAELLREAELRLLNYLTAHPRDPGAHYELACLNALRADARRAVGRLVGWMRTSPKPAAIRCAQIDDDCDFDRIRHDPIFAHLLERNSGTLAESPALPKRLLNCREICTAEVAVSDPATVTVAVCGGRHDSSAGSVGEGI